MEFLDYIKESSRYATLDPNNFVTSAKINLITNFTDDILKNLLTGVTLANGIYPIIYQTPYKQYHFELKNPEAKLHTTEPDVTFVFFNAEPFNDSEFREQSHFNEILYDIERYAGNSKGIVVLGEFILSGDDNNKEALREYNAKFAALAEKMPNVLVFDTSGIIGISEKDEIFNSRALEAFDIPFTHEFMVLLAEAWFSYVRALKGMAKKSIVLDLDNTLWGGVVGEVGANGVTLGPDGPGKAFVSFQRALLDLHDRGIILAINSKNNEEDVAEVFQKNPHMVLKEEHFAAKRINWNEKAENLAEIAKELNIGTESMVFIDDDPVHRHLVKTRFPEVTVPDLPLEPEGYVHTLRRAHLFPKVSLTEEDRKRGQMYADERKRKEIKGTTKTLDEYIKELGIVTKVSMNDELLIPRLAQLTQKTNQFNLTTQRYTEQDIGRFMKEGASVFSAHVTDKFGDYGTVIMAIIVPSSPPREGFVLDTFLMSCRVMGRGIECTFTDYVIRALARHGATKLHANFISTAKNKPIESFLPDHGFGESDDGYAVDIIAYLKKPCEKVSNAIKIHI